MTYTSKISVSGNMFSFGQNPTSAKPPQNLREPRNPKSNLRKTSAKPPQNLRETSANLRPQIQPPQNLREPRKPTTRTHKPGNRTRRQLREDDPRASFMVCSASGHGAPHQMALRARAAPRVVTSLFRVRSSSSLRYAVHRDYYVQEENGTFISICPIQSSHAIHPNFIKRPRSWSSWR